MPGAWQPTANTRVYPIYLVRGGVGSPPAAEGQAHPSPLGWGLGVPVTQGHLLPARCPRSTGEERGSEPFGPVEGPRAAPRQAPRQPRGLRPAVQQGGRTLGTQRAGGRRSPSADAQATAPPSGLSHTGAPHTYLRNTLPGRILELTHHKAAGTHRPKGATTQVGLRPRPQRRTINPWQQSFRAQRSWSVSVLLPPRRQGPGPDLEVPAGAPGTSGPFRSRRRELHGP